MMTAGTSTPRQLQIVPDLVQAQGLDVRDALSAGGRGVVWLAASPGMYLSRSASIGNADLTRGGLVQVTNLGITVKDSPESTLVFVTALDTGRPVTQARVTIRNVQNQPLWTGVTDTDGTAKAPALGLRAKNRSWEWAFTVTAEKDDDLAYVDSDWTGDIHPSSLG